MERITMTKYGFKRWPEHDFSDDGNRFTCYRAGTRVRVSKLVSDGEVYISARIDDGKILPYAVYSKLPAYKELDRLNGVSLKSLTHDDLFGLYNICLEYEAEYVQAEKQIHLPSLSEIEACCKEVIKIKKEAVDHVDKLLKENITAVISNISSSDWKQLQTYYKNIESEVERYDITKYPASIYGTSTSIYFCKKATPAWQPSYSYENIIQIIERNS